MEQKIEVVENTKGDKTYKNIFPKKHLDPGNHIVVAKVYDTGREIETQYGKAFSVTVNYLDSDVGVLFTPKEYEEFNKNCVNVGDKCKFVYTAKVAKFRKDGKEQERKYLGLLFEKV